MSTETYFIYLVETHVTLALINLIFCKRSFFKGFVKSKVKKKKRQEQNEKHTL